MSKVRLYTMSTALILLGVMLGAIGCVEEVGLIDRTNPNKLPKSQFRGVWYNIQTVVDIPPSAGFTFIGETHVGPAYGATNKIIWDIQEKMLIAYPVYEWVHGSERDHIVKRRIRNYWEPGKSDEFMEVYTGQPIAAYEILSHFDVQRRYNIASGAESNIVEENTSDRRWWERSYIRVNWARNRITDFGFVARSIESQGVDYYVQDWEEDDPDRPVMTDDFMMVTNKMFAQPMSAQACEAIQGSAWAAQMDCAGAVIKVRNAYRLVDPNNDYVPLRYHQNLEQDKFGYFLTELYGFDPERGVTVEGRLSLINRWNIWDKSREIAVIFDGHEAEGHGPLARCLWSEDCYGVHDEEGRAANHCLLDEWFEEGVCVRREIIPVSERPVRPIVFHMSATWPEQLVQEAYAMADNWSEVFKDAVAWAKYWDERGMLHPKRCNVDADCAAEALVDLTIDDKIRAIPCCTGAQEPGCEAVCNEIAGGVCDLSAQECVARTACDSNNPCRMGQSCQGGFCAADGVIVEEPVRRPDAVTAVLYEEQGMLRALQVNGAPERSGNTDNAVVRFVNATPGSTSAALKADGAPVGAPAMFNADPQRPQSVGLVGGRHVTLTVEEGGAEVASRTYVHLRNGHDYLVSYASGEIVVVEQVLTARPVTGIRVVHAAPQTGELDIGVNGALRGAALEFRDDTGYLDNTRASDQRVTVVYAGQNTAVNCFHFEGRGQCVGWAPTLDDAEYAKVAAIRDSLPEMFMACTNIYSGEGEYCDGGRYGDLSLHNDCRYSVELEDGTIANPCRDRFPEHDQLKIHGDVRYNFLSWVPKDHMASPLGYGPSAADPDTGELFYGIAHVYGAATETYGTYARDLIWLMTGTDDDGNLFGKEELISADYIRDYLAQFKTDDEYASLPAPLTAGGDGDGGDRAAAYRFAKAAEFAGDAEHFQQRDEYDPDHADEVGLDVHHHDHHDHHGHHNCALHSALRSVTGRGNQDWERDLDFERRAMEFDKQIQRAMQRGDMAIDRSIGRARLERIRGTMIEDLLITEEVEQAVQARAMLGGGGAAGTGAMSPLDWMTLDARDREHDRIMHLARNNIMVADFADDAILSLARKLGCDDPNEVETDDIYDPDLGYGKCLKGQNLRWGVTARIFRGVLEHEVGHTVGLRHNFSASNDVLNYFDEYFAIREREPVACQRDVGCEPDERCNKDFFCRTDADCARFSRVGTTCFRPRVAPGATERVAEGICVDDDGVAWCGPTAEDLCSEGYFCTSDADCSLSNHCLSEPGYEQGVCVDIYFNVYSQCYRRQMVAATCARDDDCGEAASCRGGECYRRLPCDAGQPCPEGGRCLNGFCLDEHGEPADELIASMQNVPMRKMVPRPAPTREEAEAGRIEYQYSSLMDYGGQIAWDIHGLGKYDRAAILFGYGELVEVYTDTSRLDQAVAAHAERYSREEFHYGWLRDTSFWKWAGTITHPFANIHDRIGVEQNMMRKPAPWRQVQLEQNMLATDYLRGAYDLSWIEVPYKMCSDEYRGQMSQGGCYYFDTGADILEIIYHSMVKLQEYYVFDAFKRESYGRNRRGDPLGYFNRILDRWLRPLGDAGMYYGLYYGYFNMLDYVERWQAGANSGYTLTAAVRLAMDSLIKLIGSPAPGHYVLDEARNEWRNVSYESRPVTGEGQANIPIGQGKFPYTTFWDDPTYGNAGYWRYDHALWIGSYWEKMAALLTLTENTANFMSDYVGEQLDVGVGSAVGFNTAFSSELGNYLSGLAVGKQDYYAGFMAPSDNPGQAQYVARSAIDPRSSNIRLPVVPSGLDNFSLRLYSAVYGLSYMPAGFDPSFIHALAVNVKGTSNEYDLNELVERVEFTDPFGHKTYVAHSNNYDAHRFDAAGWLVRQGNELVEAYDEAETVEEQARLGREIHEVTLLLDTLRTLNAIYGDLTY